MMMKTRASRFLALSFALAACAAAQAAAQGLEIALTWNGDDFEGFEGGLVMPREKGGEKEVLRSNTRGVSGDGAIRVSPSLIGGNAIWTAQAIRPGLYGFYVSDLGSLEGLSEPGSLARAGLRVQVRTAAGSWSFEPPDRIGAIWHVFDLIGEDGAVIPDNSVLPTKALVYGIVSDAVTGNPVEGASVTLRKKVDGMMKTALTRADGKYMIQADFGAWALAVDKQDMIGWKDEILFMGAEYPVRADAHLSSIMTDKQYRFILSWGSSPPDLDAHVIGPTPSGGRFHISYRTMRAFERRHFLDRDDTNGLGPETITIEKLDPGEYVFSVHDYTNGGSRATSALSYSGAKARLYREADLVAEADVPQGRPGTMWRVFRIDGATGQVSTLGEMLFESDPSLVR
jgi:hypothetical protein